MPTRSQIVSTFILLLLIAAIGGLFYIYELSSTSKEIIVVDDFSVKVDSFKQHLDTLKPTKPKYKKYVKKEYVRPQEAVVEYFEFDPNILDSANFIRLGLKPWMASNILKYRAKGGKFRTVDSFSKVYGIDSTLFSKLKPYIVIVQDTAEVKSTTPKYQTKQYFSVELNSADTTLLKQLPGIGSFFAKQIVYYRKQLGGFANPSQLLEISKFSLETYDKLSPYLTCELDSVKKISVNRSSVDRLKSHPYINFYQAKGIYELRIKKKKLNSFDDIKGISSFDSTQLNRLMPYVVFD